MPRRRASRYTGQSPGRPMGVMPPYSIAGRDDHGLIGPMNEHFRSVEQARLTTPFTSARVSARMAAAATRSWLTATCLDDHAVDRRVDGHVVRGHERSRVRERLASMAATTTSVTDRPVRAAHATSAACVARRQQLGVIERGQPGRGRPGGGSGIDGYLRVSRRPDDPSRAADRATYTRERVTQGRHHRHRRHRRDGRIDDHRPAQGARGRCRAHRRQPSARGAAGAARREPRHPDRRSRTARRSRAPTSSSWASSPRCSSGSARSWPRPAAGAAGHQHHRRAPRRRRSPTCCAIGRSCAACPTRPPSWAGA